jgi:16S rRNA (cytidine1402-2'-O)-methyltransferase
MAAGSAYLVPVPIGNLGDITLRALETLKRVQLIAAEDTRSTRFLLAHYQIPPPRLLSLHKFNEKSRIEAIAATLKNGDDVAVVSDAGSPGISDPAMLLVRDLVSRGLRVEALPGATALIPALTASGFEIGRFQFIGFLPLKLKDRNQLLEQIARYPYPTVVYEAPHRIRRSLEDLLQACGNRRICLAREISKLHEEYIRGNLQDILSEYRITEKGEFVLVMEGVQEPETADTTGIEEFVRDQLNSGASVPELCEALGQKYKLPRNKAYRLVLELRDREG